MLHGPLISSFYDNSKDFDTDCIHMLQGISGMPYLMSFDCLQTRMLFIKKEKILNAYAGIRYIFIIRFFLLDNANKF